MAAAGSNEPLHGGTANRGRVFRVGATVHRPRGTHSEAVHTLLRHLEESGFAGVPRLVGGYGSTEVLGYIEGSAAYVPEALDPGAVPEWALTDDALASVALLLRDYHRHVGPFGTGLHQAWQRQVPSPWRGGLVTHNDPNPANVIFRDGKAVALIDFDLAAPGSVAWELAVAACFWAPLRDERDIEDSRQGRALYRFRLLLDTYGADAAMRRDVVRATAAANAWIGAIIEDASRDGHPAFSELWSISAGRYGRAHRWLVIHRDELISVSV
jgi:hypothetical protein